MRPQHRRCYPDLVNRKGNILLVLLVIVAVLAIGAAGFWWWTSSAKAPTGQAETRPKEVTPSVDETANWKTYTNTENGVSFRYPDNFRIKNVDRVEGKYMATGESYIDFIFTFTTGKMTKGSEDWSSFGIVVAPANGKTIFQQWNGISGYAGMTTKVTPVVSSVNADETAKVEGTFTHVIYRKNDKFYEIIPPQNENSLGTDNIWLHIDQILSTFRFD